MKTNLRTIFQNLSGNTILSMDTETIVKLKGGKKNPMQGRVTKRITGSSVQVFGNSGYAAMVNRRLEKEDKAPDFLASPRAWGERVKGFPIVEHKGNEYLEAIFLKSGKVEYFLDGVKVDPATIEGLDSGEESEQGGLSDKVIIRTFNAENVKTIRAFGKVFI